MQEFIHHTRVYYEDTDAQGMVYYANYLKFAERARTEMLRELGIEQRELAVKDDTLFVVHQLDVRYHAPARLDDRLTVKTRLQDMTGARLTLQQTCWNGEQLLVSFTVVLAAISASGKAKRLPTIVREKF